MSTECDCEAKTCCPERNEGRRCWRSRFLIPEGYFRSTMSTSERREVPRRVRSCIARPCSPEQP